MTIYQEYDKLNSKIQQYQEFIQGFKEDFKRINHHRRMHKKGIVDAHTKYKSMKSHMDALSGIMKSILDDIKIYKKLIDKAYNRLDTISMYMDADEDMRKDAELSYKLTMQELREG